MGHHHHHQPAPGKKMVLYVSLAATLVFVVAEAIAGWWSGSLALVTDAFHNFTDAFGLGLAAVAYYFQSRPGNQRKTYGYKRSGVLAAFLNALTLVVLAVGLFWESYRRLRNPEPVASMEMLVMAAIGLVMNLAIARALNN